jgi:hypothetical protein
VDDLDGGCGFINDHGGLAVRLEVRESSNDGRTRGTSPVVTRERGGTTRKSRCYPYVVFRICCAFLEFMTTVCT